MRLQFRGVTFWWKLQLFSDCQFYLTPGNAPGNWVVGIADWFIFVIESVNYMSTCRVNWVSNLREISNGPDVTLKRVSNRPTSSIKGAFEVWKDFLVKDKWKRTRDLLAGTIGRGCAFLVVCVACYNVLEVYRMYYNCIYGCKWIVRYYGYCGWKLMFNGVNRRCPL